MLSTLMRRARVYSLPDRHMIWRRPAVPRPVLLPTCSICSRPVPLETCKTDETGTAVHEECYVLTLKQNRATTPAPATLE
jgi:hypothetical protein